MIDAIVYHVYSSIDRKIFLLLRALHDHMHVNKIWIFNRTVDEIRGALSAAAEPIRRSWSLSTGYIY